MTSIDFLEHGGGGSFSVVHDGARYELPDPTEQHYQWVLLVLQVGHVPGIPGDIPEWQRALAFERWCAAWDLPDFRSAQRLAYLVDHYRPSISHDLAVRGLDLGDLWRARRWTLLLDVIDRLPAHSWYASSVSMDEEHARMMAEAMAERQESEEGEERSPALTTWTPEVAAITRLIDAVKGVQHAVIAVQAGNKAPEPPKPEPRPITPLEKALKHAAFERRKRKHESLVARVLPHKASLEG